MLEDVKPECKSESTESAEIDRLAEQFRAFHERLRESVLTPAAVPVPPSLPPTTTQTTPLSEESESSPVTFGWEVIENKPALPFVRRGTEGYMANQYISQILVDAHKVLSKQTMECLRMKLYYMTQSEADVFNEINVQHCDRSLVGGYEFKMGDSMTYLEDLKMLLKFFTACQDAMCGNNFINELFGFIRIDRESEVPFVYDNDKKLVPLFYFEGSSEFLDGKAVDLTNHWKLGFLKFCFMVQKIRKNHYERDSWKVVDIEHVKKLFPADTPFEVCWPTDSNEELLTPEVRLAALHGLQDCSMSPSSSSRPQTTTTNSNHVIEPIQNIVSSASVNPAENQLGSPNSYQQNPPLHGVQDTNLSLLPSSNASYGPNQYPLPSQQTCNSSSLSQRNASAAVTPSNDSSATYLSSSGSQISSTGSSYRTNSITSDSATLMPIYPGARTGSEAAISVLPPPPVLPGSMTDPYSMQLQNIAAAQQNARVAAPRQASGEYWKKANSRKRRGSVPASTTANKYKRLSIESVGGSSTITNVPHRSPQTASSPGLQSTSPSLTEALPSISPSLLQQQNQQQAHYSYQQQAHYSHQQQTQFSLNSVRSNNNQFQNNNNMMPPQVHPSYESKAHPSYALMTFIIRYKDLPNFEMKLVDLTTNFMLKQGITSRRDQEMAGPNIMETMHYLWKGLQKNPTFPYQSSQEQQRTTPRSSYTPNVQRAPMALQQNINITKVVTNVIQTPHVQYPGTNSAPRYDSGYRAPRPREPSNNVTRTEFTQPTQSSRGHYLPGSVTSTRTTKTVSTASRGETNQRVFME